MTPTTISATMVATYPQFLPKGFRFYVTITTISAKRFSVLCHHDDSFSWKVFGFMSLYPNFSRKMFHLTSLKPPCWLKCNACGLMSPPPYFQLQGVQFYVTLTTISAKMTNSIIQSEMYLDKNLFCSALHKLQF